MAFSQPLQLSFQNFTEKDGLSDNTVHDFYQDSRGYLWICTTEGLNRFDGFSFKKFYANNKKGNSLPSNIVSQAVEDKYGYMLAATGNGLARLNMLTNNFEEVGDSLVSTKPVNYILKEGDGTIILAYTDGIALLDSNLHIKKFYKTPWPVMKIAKIRSGQLMIATLKGYFVLDINTKTFLPLSDEFNVPYFPQKLIFSYYDSASNLLFTSEWQQGLFIIDLTNKKVERYNAFPGCTHCMATNIIYTALTVKDKTWLGSDSGLFLLDRNRGTINFIRPHPEEGHSLINNVVWLIYEDRNRNLWFGTPNGISKLNLKAQNIQQYKNELLLNGKFAEINDITRGNDNKIYLSTYGNGIFRMDEDTKVIENVGSPMMPFNWSVTASGDSIIATGHDQRAYSYHPATKKIKPLNFLSPFYGTSNLLLFSFTHSSGDKWYSLNEGAGLVMYSKKEGRYFHYTNKDIPRPFSEGYFSIVKEDGEGNIWFGVNRSSHLVCWQNKTRQFTTVDFNKANGIQRNLAGISDFTINGKEIWIATSGTGIILYYPATNSFQNFTINDGLAADVVNAVIFDNEKRLWAATSKGLSCRLPGQRFFTSFGASDGLPDINFNERTRYYDPQKNKLYLGARNSLIIINPSDLLQNKDLQIRAHLDGIKINGETFAYAEQKNNILKYDQNNLQFNFSVVDLNASSGINLLYRLEGADRDWINAEGQRTASYINLPAGQYRLHLKIFKPGTNFIAYTAPFSFTIKQAWWKTILFRLFLAFAGLLVLYLIVRMYYMRKLEHQQMVFEKKQAVEQERTRIATDMHDDLGAGLTGIKFLSENIAEDNISSVARERLEKLKGSANKLIESMGEIIWAMNEKNNTIEDLLFHLRSYSLTYCEENNLTCIFNLPENIEKQVISGHTRRNIFLIVKECLHNIVKHANAKTVVFKITIRKDLVFEIQDDGEGFDHSDRFLGNGLINMQKRAKEMKGSFSLINNNGTLIQLNIPWQYGKI